MTNHLCKSEKPVIYTVSRVVKEGEGIKSIFLKGSITSKPGQFIMVWLPGVEEKPMAVSEITETEFAFCYHSIGAFTQACDLLKKGDKIGIRGPYGTAFSKKKRACVVAGGIGISSVSTLIDSLDSPVIIAGARNKKHLIYQKRFPNMIITTDDGSEGKKGFVTDALKEVLEQKKVDIVYTCGPEIMMVNVFKLCEEYGVECEASIERFMKCGFGICGNCLVDDKILCTEGPIFSSKTLRTLKEFGTCARLKTGRKVTLKEYYGWRG